MVKDLWARILPQFQLMAERVRLFLWEVHKQSTRAHDDMWDTTTWDELTRPFPKVEKGCRIILTTQEKEVALHERGFGKESCPDELLDVGKEIAQNCKGLPLVVDLIAGVVARKEKITEI
ncbi:hypothetical protein KY290_027374 [Solanum tuberosum]|uniref:NB-ARC domain-containing protein n=1 Tax=Solanum tuberosum TaxID=4113 RepID=A0ABQ7UEY2_SOLTU|nr:hypothetical protein KY290_027374 [Solanum tuberosum]